MKINLNSPWYLEDRDYTYQCRIHVVCQPLIFSFTCISHGSTFWLHLNCSNWRKWHLLNLSNLLYYFLPHFPLTLSFILAIVFCGHFCKQCWLIKRIYDYVVFYIFGLLTLPNKRSNLLHWYKFPGNNSRHYLDCWTLEDRTTRQLSRSVRYYLPSYVA